MWVIVEWQDVENIMQMQEIVRIVGPFDGHTAARQALAALDADVHHFTLHQLVPFVRKDN